MNLCQIKSFQDLESLLPLNIFSAVKICTYIITSPFAAILLSEVFNQIPQMDVILNHFLSSIMIWTRKKIFCYEKIKYWIFLYVISDMPRNENPVLFLFYIFRVKSCSIHGRTCSVVMEVTSLSRQEYTVSVGKIYLPTLHGKRKEVELFTLFLSLSKYGEDLCPTPKLEYQPLTDVHRHLYLVFP